MSPRKSCYVCGSPATSKEHSPPKCLFPKDKYLLNGQSLRKNLVTVPSCTAHNEAKAGQDQYFLYVIILSIANNPLAQNYFAKALLHDFVNNKKLTEKFSVGAIPVIAVDPSGQIQNTYAVDVDGKQVLSSLLHIAYGVYFAHFKQRWTGAVVVEPEFMLASLDPIEGPKENARVAKVTDLSDKLFANVPYHGAHPSVFKYQVHTDKDGRNAMRLHFYEGSRVTLVFSHDVLP